MGKYICVEDFANELKDFCCTPCKENGEDKDGYQCGSCSVMYLVGAVDAFPAADVVSGSAYRQVAWERDLAIYQLKEDYGVELGEVKSQSKETQQ